VIRCAIFHALAPPFLWLDFLANDGKVAKGGGDAARETSAGSPKGNTCAIAPCLMRAQKQKILHVALRLTLENLAR
jgi:hypothetical protein